MVIAKVVDALTDIWFGNIIDHSKGGNMKYYKWMLRMAVPAAVITVMMFTVPIQAGQIPAVAYVLVTNLLITAVIYTMIATPFAATMIVRTRSQQERGNMGILRAVGSYASGMAIAIATIPVTNMLGGTQAACTAALSRLSSPTLKVTETPPSPSIIAKASSSELSPL